MKKLKIILALLFITYTAPSVSETTDNEITTESISKGDFVSSIKLVGDIEAKKQTYIAPIFSSKLESLAEEGKKVKKGELVAKLESKEIEDRMAESEMELGMAENELLLLETNSEAELIKLDSNIKLETKNVEIKKLELKKIMDGAAKEELNKLKLNITLAEKALELAKKELEQKNKLFDKGVLKRKDILEQRLAVTRKEKDLNIARGEYKITKEGNTETAKEIARLELKKAENRLNIEENTLRYKKEQLLLEKKKKQTRINMLTSKVNQFKRIIEESFIKAPAEGTVVISKIWGSKGLEKVKVGDTVREGRPFLSIANLDEVLIKTQIEEQYIGKAKIGLLCNITSGNIKEKVFKGKVTDIGVLATEKKGRNFIEGASKVFDLNIDLAEKNQALKPGMSVDIEIITETRENVLLIPNKAVYKSGKQNYVFLETGEKKIIELGNTNEDLSIVTKGLSDGDKVLIEKDSL